MHSDRIRAASTDDDQDCDFSRCALCPTLQGGGGGEYDIFGSSEHKCSKSGLYLERIVLPFHHQISYYYWEWQGLEIKLPIPLHISPVESSIFVLTVRNGKGDSCVFLCCLIR